MSRVKQAVQLAQEAVQADNAGDVAGAIQAYSSSVKLITEELQSATEEQDRDVLLKYKQLYSARIATIEKHLTDVAAPGASAEQEEQLNTAISDIEPPEAAADSKNLVALPPWHLEETDMSAFRKPDPPPRDPFRRAYWMMRLLHTTMVQGGYLTPNGSVFVPKVLWYQRGAKFVALQEKLECCTLLLPAFRRLGAMDHKHTDAVSPLLHQLCAQLDMIQTSLSRALDFIPDLPDKNEVNWLGQKMNSLGGFFAKTAARITTTPIKMTDDTMYVRLLVEVLQGGQFFEDWLLYYETKGSSPVLDCLRHISHFLHAVLCAFVVQDLHGLLVRYLHMATNSMLKVKQRQS